ncbi:MAG: insulinase family protein [Clostridia bacterium]|nr:insulinase family protein [Clostridia bacterium]
MQNNTQIFEHKNETLGEMYYEIRHTSGLPIYLIPKDLSTTYALFATRYGSLDNSFRTRDDAEMVTVPDGIAHFLEHKMFEAEDGVDTFERFAKIGASANAFTSNDMTAYEFSCTDNLYEALEILLDYVMHPYFTEENVQKEQGIIGQEIQMCDDNPMRRLYYELLNLLYVRDKVKINICGTKESIACITPKLLYQCYNTFYRLSNMALIVCGKAECDRVIEVADKVLPVQPYQKIDRYYEAEPKSVAATRAKVAMSVARPLFAVGIKDVREFVGGREDERHALLLRMIADMLFGSSGEFYNEMYECGFLNNSFDASYEASRTSGFMLLWGEADDPELVYSKIIEKIKESQKNPPSEEEFLRAKRNHYAAYIRTFDSTSGIANEFLEDLFAGVDTLEVGDILSSVTYEDVVAEIQNFFRDERIAMAVVAPIAEGRGEAC